MNPGPPGRLSTGIDVGMIGSSAAAIAASPPPGSPRTRLCGSAGRRQRDQHAERRGADHRDPALDHRLEERLVGQQPPRAREHHVRVRDADLLPQREHRGGHERRDRQRLDQRVPPQPYHDREGERHQRPAVEGVLLGAVERQLVGGRVVAEQRAARELQEGERAVARVVAVQHAVVALRAEELPVQRVRDQRQTHRQRDAEPARAAGARRPARHRAGPARTPARTEPCRAPRAATAPRRGRSGTS